MSSAATNTINEYESLLLALQDIMGVVVPEAHRANLLARLKPVMSVYKLDSLSALADNLQRDDGDVRAKVLDVISRRESSWTISPDMKHLLHDYIFEQLPDNARIWLVGCGQGQLAYAIAMEMAEYKNQTESSKKFQLVASDSTEENVELARSGIYSEVQMDSLNPEYKKLYSAKTDNGENYQLKSRVSERVSFEQCDLLKDFKAMGKFDLIICPDALVYFSNDVKKQILAQFSMVLNSGGIFMGAGNQLLLPSSEFFERVNHPAGVFYRQLS